MGNNLLNKAGERCLYSTRDQLPDSTGDKLPESTGDKLPESTGDKLPESTGEMIQLSWENFWDCIGEWLHWGVCIPPGNNLIFPSRNIKTAGDAC